MAHVIGILREVFAEQSFLAAQFHPQTASAEEENDKAADLTVEDCGSEQH